MNFIDAIREYFLECPFLKSGAALGVDFLADGVSYSIDVEPCEPIVKRYADGGSMRQFEFSFNARDKYGNLTAENVANNAFLQEITDWTEAQSECGALPVLDEPLRPISISVVTGGFITEQGDDTARYVISFRLTYYQPWRYSYGCRN